MLSVLFLFFTFLIIFFVFFIFFFVSSTTALFLLILTILSVSAYLIAVGLEFFAIIYTLVYIGVVLVFFIFVIILLDLRKSNTFFSFSNMNYLIYFLFLFFSVIFDYCLIADYAVHNFFFYPELHSVITDTFQVKLSNGNRLDYTKLYFVDSYEAFFFGFFLFSYSGVLVAFLGLLLFFSLLSSLAVARLSDK